MRRVLVPQLISSEHMPYGGIFKLHGQTMGTSWSVSYVAGGVREHLGQGVQGELDKVVAQMSHWEPHSDLGRYNDSNAGSWHQVPDEFYEVLLCALEVARLSKGAYDPAIGALVNLWGFGPDRRYLDPAFIPPSHQSITGILDKASWQKIAINEDAKSVCQPGSARLDFSAIAKGYGVDRVAQYLEEQGIRHYLVEVGGELRGGGMKPDGSPWWVGLEQPPIEEMPVKMYGNMAEETVIALHNMAVATSGNYRRFFLFNGQRYAHTLDPRTGYPIGNQLASVTVLHQSCMQADALSTALTVLGEEEGPGFAEENGLAALFIVRKDSGMSAIETTALKEMLQ